MNLEKLEKLTRITVSDEAKRLAEKFGYRPYMIERYLRLFGKEETLELLKANEVPLPETIRCNDYLIPCRELQERLEEKGFILSKLKIAPHGFIVKRSPISLGATHEYLLGYYYIQGPASMLPVYELEVKPKELVLDMAAAPGGKATQILQLSKDKAKLVAVDISRKRIRALRSNLNRMGFSNFIILRADSRKLNYNGIFDKILLDAPSTGEGIIRKDPSRKKSRDINDLKHVAKLQVEMLKAGVNYLKPGGILVYAACTLAVEEGEFVVSNVIEEVGDVETLPLNIPHVSGVDEFNGVIFNASVKRCGRLLPHVHGTEGFFVCKLRKKG
jgi:NOL1/NOP2/sun family putative RNA methylase